MARASSVSKRLLGRIAIGGICWLLLAGAWTPPAHAGASSYLRCSSSGTLEYYDSYTDEWLPARVESDGSISFESAGSWWPAQDPSTGKDLTQDEIPGSCGGSTGTPLCEKGFREHTAWRQTVVDREEALRRYRAITDITVIHTGINEWEAPGGTSWHLGSESFDRPPAEIPEWSLRWELAGNYAEDSFDVAAGLPVAVETRTRSQSLSLIATRNRFGLATTLTYDRIQPKRGFDSLAYDRLSLAVTPVYAILEQSADVMDLHLIGNLSLSHSWYEKDVVFDDPSRVGIGAGLGIGRTFSFGDLRLAYLYGLTKNTSGDKEVTGKGTIPAHTVSGWWQAGISRNWSVRCGVDYTHTCDLPDAYDSAEYRGRLGVAYFKNGWIASVEGTRSFWDRNGRTWTLGVRVGRAW